MDRKCKWCGDTLTSDKLLVYNDGTFCCEECQNSPGNPPHFTMLLFWDQAIALEAILKGEINLELMEKRDQILEDLSKAILTILRRVIVKDDSKIPESDS